ncbi:hypothetical protein BGW80DRAFT_201456 [Lactifluus volemus]|nr:hypothetical protein BGW80DRAFT_201456 [Lactifluus volemus]
MRLAWTRLSSSSRGLPITSHRRPTSLPLRSFRSSLLRCHGFITRPEPGTGIKLHFRDSRGNLSKRLKPTKGMTSYQ